MRSDNRWFSYRLFYGLSNLKLDSGCRLRCNHVQSESILWVWLPVSGRFAVSFRFVSFLVLPTPEVENEPAHRSKTRPIFEAATPDDLQKFKEKNLNKNTTKSTNTWVNRFEAWRTWRKLPHKLEEIPKTRTERHSRTILCRGTQIRRQRVRAGQPTHNVGSLR